MDLNEITESLSQFFQDRPSNSVRVTVDSDEFLRVLARVTRPLVVMEDTGVVRSQHTYFTIYRGLVIITKPKEPLSLPDDVDSIEATNTDGLS